MPLYNVMQRGLKLPRIGTIRKGMQTPVLDKESGKPKKNGKGEIVMRPVEMPYFVFSIDPAQENDVKAALMHLYGSDQLTEINVFLANPDAFTNFSFWLEAYNYNQLVARSDERIVTYLFDVESNETLIKEGRIVAQSAKPKSAAGKLIAGLPLGAELPYTPDMVLGQSKGSDKPLTFKAVGRLTVVIKELKRLATFTVMTGGYWYDIPQIYSTVQIVDEITKATGRGANTIPLVLRRVQHERNYTAEDGSKKRRVSHDVELEIRSDVIAGLLETYNDSPFALSLESKPVLPVLPSGATEEPVEDYDDHMTEPIEGKLIESDAAINAPRAEPLTPDVMIDPLGKQSIEYAAKVWNVTTQQAAAEIGKAKTAFKNPMSKSLFKKIVNGEA